MSLSSSFMVFDLKAQRYDKLCLFIWILWLIDYCSALFCHISELFKELELQRESMLWKMIFCIQLVNLSRVSLQTTRFAVALALTLTKHIGAMISISHNFNYWKYASSALFSWPQMWKWRRLCLLNYWKRETRPVCYIGTQHLTRQNMLQYFFYIYHLGRVCFCTTNDWKNTAVNGRNTEVM